MINLYNTLITSLSIHRVGNKSRNEGMFLSGSPYKLDDEITPFLKEFFLKPFRDKEENYFQFSNETDLEFHPLFNLVSAIFDNPDTTHTHSQKITLLALRHVCVTLFLTAIVFRVRFVPFWLQEYPST